MKRAPLYPKREEIVRKLRWLPDRWAEELADYVDAHLTADARRADTSHKGPLAYSAALRSRLVAAVEQVPRLLHEPGCAEAVLERIRRAGPGAFGLKRLPDVESVRRAVDEVRRRNPPIPVTGTRAFLAPQGAPLATSWSSSTATT